MDILAHGLWAAIAAKAANKKLQERSEKRRVSVGWMAWWGVFPDLFAFTIPFSVLILNLVTGEVGFSDFPRPENVEPVHNGVAKAFSIAPYLYNISHSAVIFVVVFYGTWAIRAIHAKERGETFLSALPFPMLGWLLHILIDMPTHSYSFYPTPFLWPISDFKINGISWGVRWFMLLNYSSILLAYTLLFLKKKKSV